MCGIIGIISTEKIDKDDLEVLIKHAEQRGKDSSGFLIIKNQDYKVYRADYPITRLYKDISVNHTNIIMGHSRLITNGTVDNQPVCRDGIIVIHNGIIVNHDEIWTKISKKRELQIDTEVIPAVASELLEKGLSIEEIPHKILEMCKGTVSCVMVVRKLGKLCLFSNNGSLYLGEKGGDFLFSSEEFPLRTIGCGTITQVFDPVIFDIPKSDIDETSVNHNTRSKNFVPSLILSASEENQLEYKIHKLRRCSKCLLPETMPYIRFDEQGVCNYCKNYKLRNKPRPKEELFHLVEKYRRDKGNECIVPFSGGRDSSYGLHLVVKELQMKPITYTYDWGMVTDLARRNISRMCSILGVENIIVAADISKKRDNIARNLKAWLKTPNLGMISILTAGDKHFFRYVETIKKQTGINLNLWGINPLEVTHFKSGFLGVKPDFEETRVYSHGAMKQLRYQYLRFQAMLQSPGYFNRSLWDTLSGEYYRSFTKKEDYYHIFDYWKWDEKQIEETLESYDWERAPDTNSTWRIGDGTAAFYNYIYYTVAGFTEHDTFRSNQIREGDLTREEGLKLIEEENKPRYPNIKWYLDVLGYDFHEVVATINSIPKMY